MVTYLFQFLIKGIAEGTFNWQMGVIGTGSEKNRAQLPPGYQRSERIEKPELPKPGLPESDIPCRSMVT